MSTIITATKHDATSQTNADVTSLTWGQRLAIHNAYKSTIAKSSSVFGVSTEEFKKARTTHTADADFDTTPYANMFAKRKSHDENGNIIAKPRGRQTSKIADAFKAVTSKQVPLDEFCETHKVSKHVMKQRKRFASSEHSNVVCRNINGVAHIWRMSDEEAAASEVSETTV